MARSLRLEFPNAIYHVTARGNAREPVFLDDEDRTLYLACLADGVRRFGWICHAYCLMDNHYHLLIETPDANLSTGMRQLNGVYTQRFNRRHARVAPSIPRQIQGNCGGSGQLLAGVVPVCRTEPDTRRNGQAYCAISLEQLSGNDGVGSVSGMAFHRLRKTPHGCATAVCAICVGWREWRITLAGGTRANLAGLGGVRRKNALVADRDGKFEGNSTRTALAAPPGIGGSVS